MSLVNYSIHDKVLMAIDCIIFGFDGKELKLLLIKRNFEPEKDKWSLIGGFLKKEENLDNAALRILNHLTGLHDIYMEQLYSFSKIDRDPAERTLSVAYYALIDIEKYNDKLNQNNFAQWISLKEIPKLIFDHDKMVKRALARLQRRVVSKPIGFELLPDKFTMSQLKKLYESILDKKLDRRNFSSKVKSLDVLIKLNEKDKDSSKKGSFLFQFDIDKYEKKSKEGFAFKL